MVLSTTRRVKVQLIQLSVAHDMSALVEAAKEEAAYLEIAMSLRPMLPTTNHEDDWR
jgi:hypothetical protein